MQRFRSVLGLVALALVLCAGAAQASGDYAFAFVNTQGTNFYGSCVEYQGTQGKFAWSIFSDNNTPVAYDFYTFQGSGDVHQWQSNAQGFYPNHVLKTYCVVYDGNYSQVAYAEQTMTVPP